VGEERGVEESGGEEREGKETGGCPLTVQWKISCKILGRLLKFCRYF
jgi:hypothetical protein